MSSPARSAGARRTDLPAALHAADICLVPTIAQEGLSRTSVEAMASGIPVIASRIGGLPFTVSDGVKVCSLSRAIPADLARADRQAARRPGLARADGPGGPPVGLREEFTMGDT